MNTSPAQHLKENEALKQQLAEQQSQLGHKDQALNHKQTRIEQLEHKLRLLQHERFGRSSEQHPGHANLSLFIEVEWLVNTSSNTDDNDATFTT